MDRGLKQQELPFRQRKLATSAPRKPGVPAAASAASTTEGAATASVVESFEVDADEIQLSQSQPSPPRQQSPADVGHLEGLAAAKGEESLGDEEAAEKLLRGFDMDMTFGPCIGLSRLERWTRAERLGLGPPGGVWALLESNGGAACSQTCLWEGRV